MSIHKIVAEQYEVTIQDTPTGTVVSKKTYDSIADATDGYHYATAMGVQRALDTTVKYERVNVTRWVEAGNPITSLDDLGKHRYVFMPFGLRCVAFVESMPLRTVRNLINNRSIYTVKETNQVVHESTRRTIDETYYLPTSRGCMVIKTTDNVSDVGIQGGENA